MADEMPEPCGCTGCTGYVSDPWPEELSPWFRDLIIKEVQQMLEEYEQRHSDEKEVLRELIRRELRNELLVNGWRPRGPGW